MEGMLSNPMSLIQDFEGYRDTGYYATDDEKARGIVTVGYGSTHRVGEGEQITQEQARTPEQIADGGWWDTISDTQARELAVTLGLAS